MRSLLPLRLLRTSPSRRRTTFLLWGRSMPLQLSIPSSPSPLTLPLTLPHFSLRSEATGHELTSYTGPFYSPDRLESGRLLPTGVDGSKREVLLSLPPLLFLLILTLFPLPQMYLNDDDFKKVFGVDKATFAKYPPWKVKQLKQQKAMF